MEKKIISSIHYFPNIIYFASLIKYENFIIDTGENYIKQSFRNRTNILTANGIQSLTIPVKRNIKKNISSILINGDNWKQIHYKSLQNAYKKSPFYEHYDFEIKNLIFNENEKLLDYNLLILEELLEIIDIEIKIRKSSKYIEKQKTDIDLRNYFKKTNDLKVNEYSQVYEYKFKFQHNLSILDLLFNEGPETFNYLFNLSKQLKF
tara:strand:+ start:1713 stop:2330 length:618 start_codon:yes stop_codon:yes gene_type:complete